MNCDIMNNKILSANWFTRQLAAGFTFDPVVAQALYSLCVTTCGAATTPKRKVGKRLKPYLGGFLGSRDGRPRHLASTAHLPPSTNTTLVVVSSSS